jgi:ubiquinone/menaquinone biosynthesis C-methylase UbiE
MKSADGFMRTLFRVWSPFYDLGIFQRTFYRPIHRRVVRRLQGATAHTAIDLGCGTAQLTSDVRNALPGALVVGVDLSAEMLHAARTRLGDAALPLVRANVYSLPFKTGSIDIVTSSISYHWYRTPDRALAEISRVLRPGGRFVLATMSGVVRTVELGATRLATIADTRAAMARVGLNVTTVERLAPLVTLFDATRG